MPTMDCRTSAAFGTATALRATTDGGTSGSGCRRSTATKKPIAASPSSPDHTVAAERQPRPGPDVTAKSTAAEPSVTATPPSASTGPRRSDPRSPGRAGHRASISATTGTVSQKIQRHPHPSVITPPPTMPATNPRPAIAPYVARARLRARLSVKVAVSSDNELGTKAPAARPCTTRPANSIQGCTAAPASTEPAASTTSPATNIRRRPTRSPSRPNSKSSPPKTTA
jgi:hypothetical protein